MDEWCKHEVKWAYVCLYGDREKGRGLENGHLFKLWPLCSYQYVSYEFSSVSSAEEPGLKNASASNTQHALTCSQSLALAGDTHTHTNTTRESFVIMNLTQLSINWWSLIA